MRARQTCFCGLFGSGTTVSRRCRSPEVSVNETPGRILQTSVIDKSEEHNNGYICNDQSTRDCHDPVSGRCLTRQARIRPGQSNTPRPDPRNGIRLDITRWPHPCLCQAGEAASPVETSERLRNQPSLPCGTAADQATRIARQPGRQVYRSAASILPPSTVITPAVVRSPSARSRKARAT